MNMVGQIEVWYVPVTLGNCVWVLIIQLIGARDFENFMKYWLAQG